MAFRFTRILAALTLTTLAAVAPVRAGLDVDFGVNAAVGDANLFFSISSRYFDRDVRAVEDWNRRFPRPDDLAVALHLARYCDRGPEFFVSLRRAGLGWFEISNRCNVAPDVFFVAVDREPGPPYGRAYGYWKKQKRDPKAKFVLNDRQVRDLVAVRMAHEYYGVPIDVAMDWRRSGRDVGTVMVSQYHVRHGKGRAGDDRGKGGGNGAGGGGKGKGSKEKKAKGGKH